MWINMVLVLHALTSLSCFVTHQACALSKSCQSGVPEALSTYTTQHSSVMFLQEG